MSYMTLVNEMLVDSTYDGSNNKIVSKQVVFHPKSTALEKYIGILSLY